MLLVWGVLLLVRVFKPIPAARIGIAVLAVSFVVLGCTDPDRRIAEATLTRWEQGTDPMLDTGVLSACGATQYSGEEKGTSADNHHHPPGAGRLVHRAQPGRYIPTV